MKGKGSGRAKSPLWTPSAKRIDQANLTGFIEFVNREHHSDIKTYAELYSWSITQVEDFWAAIWDFVGIVSSKKYDKVVDGLSKFPGAEWFPGARLNFAENLLKHRDERTALVSKSEGTGRSVFTHSGLYQAVGAVAHLLKGIGVRSGDQVASYMPNVAETTIAMLATTSIGAVWVSCGAELGPGAVVDRIGQVHPRVLFAADGYLYKGARMDSLQNVARVAERVPSLEKIVIVPRLNPMLADTGIPDSVRFPNIADPQSRYDVKFEQLPSNHPIYIMFSSGTTGKPKCMVQGAAGVLVNQLKEIVLHADVTSKDCVTYIASPSWMMWNWLMTCLATGASVVSYDGNPNYPDWGTMWRLVQDERITLLGCSASYINHLRSLGAKPGQAYDLSSLREISQTGSPLSPECFEWVYGDVKKDLHLNSISGGTDINGCFAGGVPILPVYPGELQAPGLGMKINAYDPDGNPVRDQLGELVCEAPAPSMPLFFWNDPNNQKYREAYFDFYGSKGKNVWRHGDYIIIHSNTSGITFCGRSDSVLKSSGVRIGTSEIYNIVEKIPEVADSLAVGQDWKGEQRIILFVRLAAGYRLSDELKQKIRQILRQEGSPRHVPTLIVEVPDIPYTFNMKKVETAVANIVNGKPVTNRDALGNPDSLDFYERLLPELQKE